MKLKWHFYWHEWDADSVAHNGGSWLISVNKDGKFDLYFYLTSESNPVYLGDFGSLLEAKNKAEEEEAVEH